MKIDFLLKWWYKGDNLTEIVKSSRNEDDPLDLSKEAIDTKVNEILKHRRLRNPWSEDAMKRAIKSTLKEVIRNERTELIAKAVFAIRKFPKKTTKTSTVLERNQELTKTEKATALQQDEKLKLLTVGELKFIISNCDKIAENFFNEGIFKTEKTQTGKKEVICNPKRLSKTSKIINKNFEEAIKAKKAIAQAQEFEEAIAESKAKVDCTKYFEYRYEYRRDEEAFFDATDFDKEKTRELDQLLISNLKKDLFENINEETIESYISVQLSPSNYQFNKRREDCNLLFLRLDDKEIQKKLKILTVIEFHAPELLETFTESERKFIKLVNKYPSIDELDQLLISNLKKDLFENINQETIKYIVDQLFHTKCQFNEENLYKLTFRPDCTLSLKGKADCNRLFKRLEKLGDKEIQKKFEILTLIKGYAPELLNTFTENERKFIEIAARGGRAQKKPQ
jgi:hypothetical protein